MDLQELAKEIGAIYSENSKYKILTIKDCGVLRIHDLEQLINLPSHSHLEYSQRKLTLYFTTSNSDLV